MTAKQRSSQSFFIFCGLCCCVVKKVVYRLCCSLVYAAQSRNQTSRTYLNQPIYSLEMTFHVARAVLRSRIRPATTTTTATVSLLSLSKSQYQTRRLSQMTSPTQDIGDRSLPRSPLALTPAQVVQYHRDGYFIARGSQVVFRKIKLMAFIHEITHQRDDI